MPRLVLASASRYRRGLLSRLGVPFDAMDHRVDEKAFAAAPTSGDALALDLARAKAESVRDSVAGAFVIGSDQVVDFRGEPLGKPGTRAAACAQLGRLAGRTHRLVTAVVLVHPDGRRDAHVDVHAMTMRSLSPEEIERYVDADEPLDCCGSYRIEKLGIALFERILGDDFTAIEGLPLMTVARMLRDAGFSAP